MSSSTMTTTRRKVVAGAAVGLLVAQFGTRALVALITTPGAAGAISLDLSINSRLLGFTVLVATATVVLCGLVPAWRATRVSAQTAMKAQARGVVEGHTRFRIGKALVVAQVALSLMLVVSAGFLIGSFRNLTQRDPGFDPEGVLISSTPPSETSARGCSSSRAASRSEAARHHAEHRERKLRCEDHA